MFRSPFDDGDQAPHPRMSPLPAHACCNACAGDRDLPPADPLDAQTEAIARGSLGSMFVDTSETNTGTGGRYVDWNDAPAPSPVVQPAVAVTVREAFQPIGVGLASNLYLPGRVPPASGE